MQSEIQNKIKVLCTRPIPEELVKHARLKGIEIDCITFIDTEPIETVEVQQEIENALILSTTVVFTSMNAVEAVAEFLLDEHPDWRIYCIGNTTQKLVRKYFGKEIIAGTSESAASLAQLIIEDESTDELIFFCGDQRRDELPQMLVQHNIEVQEIVVYQTFAVPQKISKRYQAILFFSPSAVDSFFSINKIETPIIFFAIGSTTAAAVAKYTANTIIIADEPGKEALVLQVIDFFL